MATRQTRAARSAGGASRAANTGQLRTEIRNALDRHRDPDRAVHEKAYLKSDLEFLGTSLPRLDEVMKAFRARHADLGLAPTLALVDSLWASRVHEEKAAALRLMRSVAKSLRAGDLGRIEHMLDTSNTWAYVDELSVQIVGRVLMADPSALKTLRRWARHRNFWVRRAALLGQFLLFRRDQGDREFFFAAAASMLGEKEFFIRKAIGWGLRELCKHHPREVAAFVRQHRETMSPLTFREATRKLPDDLRPQA